MKLPDRTRKRIFGTPGVPGPYHDLPRSRVGAQEAERRAISEAVLGKPLVAAMTTKEAPKTIKEHAETFVEKYKPSERREKRRVLNSHLLPFFGAMTIDGLKQTDVDTYAQSELDRGMAVKTVNNQLAVLSTLIKYTTSEESKLRFKLDGMAAEIAAVATEDVEKVLDACHDQRYTTLILLAAEAGLRAAEVRGFWEVAARSAKSGANDGARTRDIQDHNREPRDAIRKPYRTLGNDHTPLRDSRSQLVVVRFS